ncbi:hypothetical protein SDC9_144208 [bioreactor metagenome]|uniref:Uncharacterized protein n=1 Tax=bioreactor metagenome TaxID=1076179 RepID=A0A645E5K4_9ZZZZ
MFVSVIYHGDLEFSILVGNSNDISIYADTLYVLHITGRICISQACGSVFGI